MRNLTKSVVTVASLGVMGVAFAVGSTVDPNSGFINSAAAAGGAPPAGSVPAASNSSSSGGAPSGSSPASAPLASNASGSQVSKTKPKATASTATQSSTSSGTSSQTQSSASGSSTSASGGAASSAASSNGSSSAAAASTNASSTSLTITKSGSLIYSEPHSGQLSIQLSVTKVDGKITAISTSGSTATQGRSQCFPYLVSSAIVAQGATATCANQSGATYTVDAFNKALTTVLAKF